MMKKPYVLAIISFLLIPVVTLLGGVIFSLINPEIAAGQPNYERNYRLIELVKNASAFAAFLVAMGLWVLTCFFLLKSKKQSYWWLILAMFGPFGMIVLSILDDRTPEHPDYYRRFVRGLNRYLRVAYELCVFVVVWILAFLLMVLKSDLSIEYEAFSTGTTAAQVIEVRNASSGMWAFSEGLEILYLVVLLYLLWPACFNLAARLPRFRSSAAIKG